MGTPNFSSYESTRYFIVEFQDDFDAELKIEDVHSCMQEKINKILIC